MKEREAFEDSQQHEDKANHKVKKNDGSENSFQLCRSLEDKKSLKNDIHCAPSFVMVWNDDKFIRENKKKKKKYSASLCHWGRRKCLERDKEDVLGCKLF